MKKILFASIISILFFSSCGLNKQADLVQALEKCKYQISSADSLIVAGRDVKSMLDNKQIDMDQLPGFALAYLRKDIPFKARLNLQIQNPSENRASINQFDYKVLLKGQELATGNVTQKVNVEPGGTTTVPVNIKGNLYQILANGKTMQEIMDFVKNGTSGGPERKGVITLKIRPTIEVGNKLVQMPGYITIDKEVSSNILF